MNNQPLNLLAPSNAEAVNSSDCGAHPPPNQLGDQRQMALASLFSSLTSLANSQQPVAMQQQQQQQQQQQIATSSGQQQLQHPLDVSNHHQATTSSSMVLTSSIQSVMAAMMQQHLVTAVSHHQQQAHQPPAPIFLPGDQNVLFNERLGGEADGQQQQQQQQQQQHQQQMHQRINYCTICNKELCNKYFMKTHMLKMHKINLEMEQPENESGDRNDGDDDDDDGAEEEDSKDVECNNNNADEQRVSASEPAEQNDSLSLVIKKTRSNKTKMLSSGKPKNNTNKRQTASQATSVMNGFAGNSMGGVVCDICNKELCSKYFLKVHKQNTHGIQTDYQDANQFMYQFGGPMAGSNPFLTPATLAAGLAPAPSFPPLTLFADQQPQQQQQQQCSNEPTVSKKSAKTKRIRLSQNIKQSTSPPSANIEKSNILPESASGSSKQFESVYRLLLAQQQQRQQPQPQPQFPLTVVAPTTAVPPPPLMPMDPISANPLGALMCFGAMGPPGPFGPAGMSPAMIVDNILRNQHLFNRNNASGSNMSQQPEASAAKTDRNNNTKTDLKQTTNAKTKDSPNSNSRYLSHYTEACPMCDRRFKSIKWLKTHMMNDHKQEIGAYMQMMMQYLYTSKSQQMAAAATMAAIEQRQQQQHQNLINHFTKNQLPQHNQPTSLLNKCFNLPMINHHHQQRQATADILNDQNQMKQGNSFQYYSKQQPKITTNNRVSSPPEFIGKHGGDQADFAIDARCRQESLSPGESLHNRQSSASPLSRSHGLGFMDNHLVCGLNFDLEQRFGDQRGGGGQENFLMSHNSRANSDILGDNTGDSDQSREEAPLVGGAHESPTQSTQQI